MIPAARNRVLPRDAICDVWSYNFQNSIRKMIEVSRLCPIAVIKVISSGIPIENPGPFPNLEEQVYYNMRTNSSHLKIIQLGITFFERDGNILLERCSTFQINFKFDAENDKFSEATLHALAHVGVNFGKHRAEGVDPEFFGERLLLTGFLVRDDLTYVFFNGGHDLSYIIRMLTTKNLPVQRCEFLKLVKMYFPTLYDLRTIMSSVQLHGDLQDLMRVLHLSRQTPAREAGILSLQIGMCFFTLKKIFLRNVLERNRFNGAIWNLGGPYVRFLPNTVPAHSCFNPAILDRCPIQNIDLSVQPNPGCSFQQPPHHHHGFHCGNFFTPNTTLQNMLSFPSTVADFTYCNFNYWNDLCNATPYMLSHIPDDVLQHGHFNPMHALQQQQPMFVMHPHNTAQNEAASHTHYQQAPPPGDSQRRDPPAVLAPFMQPPGMIFDNQLYQMPRFAPPPSVPHPLQLEKPSTSSPDSQLLRPVPQLAGEKVESSSDEENEGE